MIDGNCLFEERILRPKHCEINKNDKNQRKNRKPNLLRMQKRLKGVRLHMYEMEMDE